MKLFYSEYKEKKCYECVWYIMDFLAIIIRIVSVVGIFYLNVYIYFEPNRVSINDFA